MKVYHKRWEQVLESPIDVVWDFFANPANLSKITPPDMQFKILSGANGKDLYQGLMIEYEVSPFPIFTTRWLTEITAVEPLKYFIDEQRAGPFKLWHHQHHFTGIDPNQTLMVDTLHYSIPFGLVGRLVNLLAISNRVEQIFAYRQSVISKYFPKLPTRPLTSGSYVKND